MSSDNQNQDLEPKKRKFDEKNSISKLILYSYWRSSSSYRVRLALAYKGILTSSSSSSPSSSSLSSASSSSSSSSSLSVELRPINLLSGQQGSDEYAKINPQKQVPALIIVDGVSSAGSESTRILTQSLAIIEYIEEINKQNPLLPDDPFLRNICRSMFLIFAADTQPIQNLWVLNKISNINTAQTDKLKAKQEWAQDVIANGMKAYEVLVGRYGGQFSVGDSFTLADTALMAQHYNAVRWGVDMSAYPLINGVLESCSKIADLKKAHPDEQPDATK